MQKNILKIRIVLWLILAVIIGWLAYLKIVPGGQISYLDNDFSQSSFFIGRLTPAERVVISQAGAQIKGDPVYFSLRTPRRFERARVTVTFKNTTVWPVMEIGLLNDKIAWGYELKPLENKVIDQLSLVWPVVEGKNGVRLIERGKNYDTLEKFLSNLPARAEIALYDYNLKNKFLLDKYEPQPEKQQIDYSIRGSYQFYTYIKNEELEYTFDFIDLNLNQDNDPVEVKVYSPDGLIYSKYVADETGAGSEGQASFKIDGLPAGVYRLSFIANDDIITKKITSRQSQFALINRVWLADDNKKNLVLYTNSRSISAQTIDPASKGKIKVGDSALDLNETYKQISLKIISQPAKPELAQDNILISGDGVFSLSEGGLLDPRFKNVDKNIDINQEKINYILTSYQEPLKSGDWRIKTVDFDLTKAYQENGKYQFLISVPGFKAEDQAFGELIIKEIKIDLTGTSLRQKLDKYFKR